MSTIELTGLRADIPIGAMAAFGILRLVTLSERVRESRLAWAEGEGGFHAVLHANADIAPDELISLLLESVREAPNRKALTWTEQLKSADAQQFRKTVKEIVEEITANNRSEVEWMAAFGNEMATDEGKLEPTPFDMSVARQKFPADAVRLALSLASTERGRKQKTAQEEYREALFGPWQYQDDQHSFGWDPSTVKLGAFTYKAPTAMANAGVRAAVWLAFESLPLFPVFARGHRQRTRAFDQGNSNTVFCWPVWTPPITLYELQSLLASAALVSDDPRTHRDLQNRGLIAIYRSIKFKPNKYMVTFGPAELSYSAAV